MDDTGKRLLGEFISDRYRLMAFIRGMVRDNHAAEDIFQEVWLRLDGAIRQGVAVESTPGWCRGVARNLILHHWRDRKRDRLVGDEHLLDLVAAAFEERDQDQSYWRARENALRQCLAKLPGRAQEILSMKYDSGFSLAEVAERLGKTVDAATKIMSRLRRKLRECVSRVLELQGATP